MTPQERILAAIRGDQPDRLPVATYNCHPFSFGPHADCPEYAPILEAIRRTGAGMLCKTGCRFTGGLAEPEWIETKDGDETVLTQIHTTPAGQLKKVDRYPPDQPGYTVEHYIKSDEDIEIYAARECTPVEWDVEELLKRIAEIGDDGLAYVGYHDPMAEACRLFESEDLLVRSHVDPEPVMRLIELSFQRIVGELRSFLDATVPTGAKFLLHTAGPELATPPLMPPAFFAKAVTPYQTELVAMIREAGVPAVCHCHGRVRLVLDEMLKCGFSAIEPIEPPIQGDISLAELREAVGERMCLIGYVQDQELHMLKPDDIRAHVAGIVGTIGKGTRYVCTPTCTPFQMPPTPQYVENYVAFLEAAAELGA